MSVLQRKARAGKQEHQARSMTVAKSLRVSFAKVADTLLDLAVAVIGVTRERCDGELLPEKIDENALLLLLDGPGGATGGAIVGHGLVAALIQQQTTGRVSAPRDAMRRMTATDAALCAPVLDALFERANGLLEIPQDRAILDRFKFGARSENARLFNLALGGPEYHLVHMTVDIAGGTVQSSLTLILPDAKETAQTTEAPGHDTAAAPRPTLGDAVMVVPTDLRAVLCKVRLSLSQMNDLTPGMTLPVSAEAFEDVSLIALDGRCIARGVMGQVEGQRALMIDPAAFGKPAERGQGATAGAGKTADVARHLEPQDASVSPAEDTSLEALPDLPDVIDMPDLPDMEPMEGDGDGAALPDLPDFAAPLDLPELPDYDDLPDLDSLPKFNIA